jgi:hypothetical protein
MPDVFKPLIAPTATTAAATGTFQPKVVSASPAASSVPSAKAACGAADTRASAEKSASAHASADRPVVTFEREGDQVKLIRVTCTCGQVIELECTY